MGLRCVVKVTFFRILNWNSSLEKFFLEKSVLYA